MRHRLAWGVLWGLGGWLMLTQDAHAYIDPGTGSFLFQMGIAVVMGALFTVKQWWRGLLSVFKRRSDR